MGFKYPLNPYGGLMVQPVAMAGGLNDSQAIADPTTMQVLSNWVVFRGRFAVRAPVAATVQLLDDAGSPAAVTSVLAGRFHKNKFYVVAFSSNTNKTYLYRLNPDGTSEGTPNGTQSTFVAVLWTGSTLPAPVMVSFDGGIAGTPVSRLYICDNNNQYDTRFWNSDANSINDLQNDFADSGALHNTRYTTMFKYQYTLWGTNFYQFGLSSRPEMLRFSQPGLIPAIEPDMLGAVGVTAQEWWNVDHREVGDRGDPVTTTSYAGGAAIIYKRRSAYALFGYDAESWSLRPISDKVGAVGPYAACSTEDGFSFFWSDRGPHMTDGQTPVDIGVNIRKFVQAVGFNPNISCEYSVDDSIVYFCVPGTGTGVPDTYLAYQRQQTSGGAAAGLFSSGQWLGFSGSPMLVNSLAPIPNQTLPGPQAPPSGFTAVATSGTTAHLAWTNGDTSTDTVTEIWRGPTSGTETKLTQVSSGVAVFDDTGLTSTTNYFYEVRHVRNNQNSAYSSEQSTRTWVATPTAVSANSISTGVRISYTNNQSGADVVVERGVNGTTFSAITTISNPGTGAHTYDDTTGTVGQTYYYRLKATKAAETDSTYTAVVNAIFGFPAPDITSVHLTLGPYGPCLYTVTLDWGGNFFTSNDTAKIYQKIGAGSFGLVATVSLSLGTYSDIIDNPGSNTTIQYRVDAYDEGTSLSDSMTSNTVNYNHIAGCPA